MAGKIGSPPGIRFCLACGIGVCLHAGLAGKILFAWLVSLQDTQVEGAVLGAALLLAGLYLLASLAKNGERRACRSGDGVGPDSDLSQGCR